MSKYGLVAVGYNRPAALSRLLESLNAASFDREVLLIVSLDYAPTRECRLLAESFEWKHGQKEVIAASEKLGLKNHILKCGSYLEQYDLDAIAVFEDDIVVSPYFWPYMTETVSKYGQEDKIAGISLYSFRMNNLTGRPFEPMRLGADVYFQQTAQSWGQIWTRKGWKAFEEWYHSNEEWPPAGEEAYRIPSYIRNWPENSWLKYHDAYCILQGKYFVYPYQSLTTPFGDAGTNNSRVSTQYQVPCLKYEKAAYDLPDLADAGSVRYDGFFENENLADMLSAKLGKTVTVDLYSSKELLPESGCLLTSRFLRSGRIISTEDVSEFGLILRPMEENILEKVPGKAFRIYEITPELAREAALGRKKKGANRWNLSGEALMNAYAYDTGEEQLPIGAAMSEALHRLVKHITK